MLSETRKKIKAQVTEMRNTIKKKPNYENRKQERKYKINLFSVSITKNLTS